MKNKEAKLEETLKYLSGLRPAANNSFLPNLSLMSNSSAGNNQQLDYFKKCKL